MKSNYILTSNHTDRLTDILIVTVPAEMKMGKLQWEKKVNCDMLKTEAEK